MFRRPTTNTSASAITAQAMSKAISSASCPPCKATIQGAVVSPPIPSPPRNLTFTYTGAGQVEVHWTPSVPDGISNVIAYSVLVFAVVSPAAPAIASIGIPGGGIITWYTSEFSGANFIASYTYTYYDITASGPTISGTLRIIIPGQQTHLLRGLIPGHQYSFTIIATNDQGLIASSTTTFISV